MVDFWHKIGYISKGVLCERYQLFVVSTILERGNQRFS